MNLEDIPITNEDLVYHMFTGRRIDRVDFLDERDSGGFIFYMDDGTVVTLTVELSVVKATWFDSPVLFEESRV